MPSGLVTSAVMLSELKTLAVSAAAASIVWQILTQPAFSNVMILCQTFSLQLRCIPAYGHQLVIKFNRCPGATRGVWHRYQAKHKQMLDTWKGLYGPATPSSRK